MSQQNQSRLSVTYTTDWREYNAGEKAVWDAHFAHALARSKVAVINDHPVKDDSNKMAMLSGDVRLPSPDNSRLERLESAIEKLMTAVTLMLESSQKSGGMSGALKK